MIFDRIGVDGNPARTTDYGTEYVTFHVRGRRWYAYIWLCVHMAAKWLSASLEKPIGAPENLFHDVRLIWRKRPEYADGCLRARLCFEHSSSQTLEMRMMCAAKIVEQA